jgi:hypothetical protein
MHIVDPDQLKNSRKFAEHAHSSSSSSSSAINKTTSSSSFHTSSANLMDSPKGMSTSMSRNVRGQVTFDTLRSPKKPQSSTLSSTHQLSNSMKKIGGNSQNSFCNDTTRYMDQTQSRKAAWGPNSSSAFRMASGIKETSSKSQQQQQAAAAGSLQVKTVYGSSSAWLMDFRLDVCKYCIHSLVLFI